MSVRFELWLIDERGVLSKPKDGGDHTGFAKVGSIRGWARIERKAVVLFRTDKAEDVPRLACRYYQNRYPSRSVEDRAQFHRHRAQRLPAPPEERP